MQVLALIPSPTRSVWHLGPLPIRAYALCIIVGIVVAVWLTTRRWRERGGNPDHVWDIAAWAIVLGILGGRLYHVASDPELYFLGRPGTSPIDAFKIWDGGLGIWGAIFLGGVGAGIGCRRQHAKLSVFADAAVPGVIFAQGIGRWGNWFNNELFGGHTSLPWGLQVHCIQGGVLAVGGTNGEYNCPTGSATLAGLFQPTFLYESLWDLAIGVALLLIDRRLRLGRGNVAALYVMGYTVGRAWIEALRHDHANHILGLRLNDWTSLIVFLIGLAWFLTHGGFHAEREPTPYRDDGADAGTPPPEPHGDNAPAATTPPDGPESDEEVSADGGRDR